MKKLFFAVLVLAIVMCLSLTAGATDPPGITPEEVAAFHFEDEDKDETVAANPVDQARLDAQRAARERLEADRRRISGAIDTINRSISGIVGGSSTDGSHINSLYNGFINFMFGVVSYIFQPYGPMYGYQQNYM